VDETTINNVFGENLKRFLKIGNPREGWDAAFQAMAAQGDDEWLDGELGNTSTWDEEEWE